jgi:hypothetical protein
MLILTIKLKAKVASEEDKQWVAGVLQQTSMGSLEGDMVELSLAD